MLIIVEGGIIEMAVVYLKLHQNLCASTEGN